MNFNLNSSPDQMVVNLLRIQVVNLMSLCNKPEILVAYSPYCNEGVFHEIKKAFMIDKYDHTSVLAEKELFEENLVNDNLKFAYVEVYSNEAKYYFQQEKTENTMLEFYYMTVHDELVFLFLISPFRILNQSC